MWGRFPAMPDGGVIVGNVAGGNPGHPTRLTEGARSRRGFLVLVDLMAAGRRRRVVAKRGSLNYSPPISLRDATVFRIAGIKSLICFSLRGFSRCRRNVLRGAGRQAVAGKPSVQEITSDILLA